MKLNLMAWNVDWLRNRVRSTCEGKYSKDDCSPLVYQEIIRIVKEFLKKENAAVCLQEFPTHYLKQLKKDFPNDEYDIWRDNSKAKRYTLWISKKGVAEEPSSIISHNRVSTIQIGGCVLIGVHMPTNFKDFVSDYALWKRLISCMKNQKNVISIGDYNAYTDCDDINVRSLYKELSLHCTNVVSEKIPTFIGGTSVDKVLINDKLLKYVKKRNIALQEDFELSDHKYIQAEFEFEDAF